MERNEQNYYDQQLELLSKSGLTVKFVSNAGDTKWMKVNNESVNDFLNFFNKLKDEAVKENIESGGVFYTDRGTTYSVSENSSQTGYVMSYHQDELPAYDKDNFNTIEETLIAMKKIAMLSFWCEMEEK